MVDSDPQAIYAVIFLVVIAFLGFREYRKADRRKWILKENLPEELKLAKLVASEQYIKTAKPRKVHGTLDQLYRLKSKVHVLVESKTRKKPLVYLYDIVQLSIYNLILIKNGRRMADYAYIRVVSPSGVSYMKKKLLSEAETIKHYDRAKEVKESKVTPRIVKHKAMCNGCGQQENCDSWQHDNDKKGVYRNG